MESGIHLLAELRVRRRGRRHLAGTLALALAVACLGSAPSLGVGLEAGQLWMWVVPGVSPPVDSGVSIWISGYQAGIIRLEVTVAVVDAEGEFRGRASWVIEAGRAAEFSLDSLLAELPAGQRGSVLLSGQDAGPGRLSLRAVQRAAGAPDRPLPGDWLASDPTWLPSLAEPGPAGG